MANIDIEVGGGQARNKMKWWHRGTQQNNTYIPDTLEILLDRKKEGGNLFRQQSPSIYMIPSRILRNSKKDFFKPQVVSIGPLHGKDETLKQFEEQKTIYLYQLLQSLNTSSRRILDKCLEWVNASIPQIKKCYGVVINYTDAELAQMMVMDACFILGFLFLSEEHQRFTSRNAILTRSIFHDLVLLENQIPFFVLQGIYNCTIFNFQTGSLSSGVLLHLKFLIPFKEINYDNVRHTPQPHHILGLLQKVFHPTRIVPHMNIAPARPPLNFPNHSATELDKAGVKFEPRTKEGNWTLAIDFSSSSWKYFKWWWGNCTLTMPTLCIDENTELVLRNIIAYEQCTLDVPDYVTSYVSAIDMLLDTKEDLSKLVKSKILTNNLGSNKDATKMLNKISEQFVFEEFYYKDQWEELHKYCNRYVPKNIALLRRTYFNSPWSIIALLAGIVVFAIAIIQLILRIMK